MIPGISPDDGGIGSAPQPVVMAQGAVTLSTGRQVHFAIPKDITDAELLELVAWMTAVDGGLRTILRADRPVIALPGGMVLPPRG